MTRLFNDPDDFLDELTEGFVAASGRWVRAVPGGVVRSTRSPEPTVAIVIGGGSGHYPAFAGLVGPGLAHGAAMGNLFASPSTQRAYSVAKEADQGRGVLFSYGNYAGDVLNFDAAQDQLKAEGIDCRTVLVTDDIWSAPPDEFEKRRGIAGDLTVFKVAGAAAEEGASLDEVERLARHTNDRTRSFGVAFDGCTLPGKSEPLFTVPQGRMAVGLGIHGEPGIDETDVPTADELAELFVSRLLQEVPEGVEVSGARVVPILNGLGSVKYEELFVVYRSVDRLLRAAGVEVVDPEVGEFCTSFDMAGCSLTLLWLGNEPGGELERLWTAPADTPAFRRGSVSEREHVDSSATAAAQKTIPPASDESRHAATYIADLLARMAEAIDAQADELGRMDSVAGDGDHGIGMQRGSRAGARAARSAADAGAGAGTTLAEAGDAWSDQGGGTSGVIWGRILQTLGKTLGDEAPVNAAVVAAAVGEARDVVMGFGKAKVGDKTMVDAIVPFADDLSASVEAGRPLRVAWPQAAAVAEQAAQQTADMAAKLGRARSHGDKSIGTPDPGAVSFALICTTVAGELPPADGAG
ncbi:dihydroxyacetone kinase family protein [Pseudonocardia charpentierae]|uniref:Dihydroxyacetone kinase family protein n=1 Tax=Pseudonocardia charpentierae TaxID=3075545 RepID=A0ABU2N2F1_9PSEU|nr:dihydroxyacetone kinase family protein [Pseudonocardia sp. DSM 45834]MDT0347950.1 dihydroxyacetone kinase family protein [Pseudonocardia sp. DSM 45834]